ncbi:PorT family protein [Mucilaginibacter sp. BJC16-A38]|uniref:porin family protein n=1 Tax=Mucilaginibacter phenanthrenivorans TaxID=1234842 RepID=UPI00215722DE|nr:porin family protein [Mucilaginibacter phenanthrenivorans]MCR8560894.1 PorT family protein [Mucilaginibacter phenanthrenivorans]
MKKLMLICLVLVSAKGFSQSIMQRLEFGIKAGTNVSNFTNADFATDPLIGFHAGATVAFKITNNFLVQEEFLFSTQGAKIKGGTLGTQDLKLYYMAVPFLLKYRTNSGFYVEAGTQVGIKVKEDIAGINTDNYAKKIDLAAAGGIGYQSKMGLGIGARYLYGISKVANVNVSNITNDYKNNSIQASVFYVF